MKKIPFREVGWLPTKEGLKAAKYLIRVLEENVKEGWLQMRDIEIGYPGGDVQFTPEEYFQFALDSVETAIKSTNNKGEF